MKMVCLGFAIVLAVLCCMQKNMLTDDEILLEELFGTVTLIYLTQF